MIRSIHPNTFNVGVNLPIEVISDWKRKGWLAIDWRPDIELEETSKEIKRIMERNSDFKEVQNG
jgi:hypothetical protein